MVKVCTPVIDLKVGVSLDLGVTPPLNIRSARQVLHLPKSHNEAIMQVSQIIKKWSTTENKGKLW